MNSLPKTVTRQRHGCDLNPGPPALESSMLATRLQNHPTIRCVTIIIIIYICASAAYSTSSDAACTFSHCPSVCAYVRNSVEAFFDDRQQIVDISFITEEDC